ncbi:hypothetical protein [Haloplanus halophilus]|uniref:hypothetical protein n=1 Tax=Haloplanus halophilus TaxID=2949993 RepID=UPI00204165A3|nr:hypothetical protein [Haloplanus sp. GDY1]
MPEIEITPEQEERLRALQEDIARDVVGKYGHVRPRDAVEFLLDRYAEDEDADPGDGVEDGAAAAADTDGAATAADTDGAATAADTDGAAAAADETPDPDEVAADAPEAALDDAADGESATARVVDQEGATDGETSGGDDAMLNEMMSLLDTHDDKWGESGGDERYEVELPDGGTEQVRTKDDVKALLFEHYR